MILQSVENPFLAIKITKGDRWAQINGIRGGMRRDDQRSYGDALRELYSELRAIAGGDWGKEERKQIVELVQTAAQHGSIPMAMAAILALADHSVERREFVWGELDDKQKQLFNKLMPILLGDREMQKFIHTKDTENA